MAPRSRVSAKASAFLFALFARGIDATAYSLVDSYSGATFYDNFDFVTSDPSGGWVTYVDQATAQANGYASASDSGAYLGVDYTSVLDPSGPGRNSVRIESTTSYTYGLLIGDFDNMPTGCGLWPAFWMYGQTDWPTNGEIDIIEGVNNQNTAQISGHTGDGCVIAGGDSTATLEQNTCYQPSTNSGCYFIGSDTTSFGTGFNTGGGGVYAMEWTSDEINVWGWSRDAVPSDIAAGTPDTSTWGTPEAQFAGSTCDIPSHFNNMAIVLNVDFCGPWAGSVFTSAGCGSDCIDYVAETPSAFQDAYWQVNSINIYTASGTESNIVHKGNSTMFAPARVDASPSFSSVVPQASIHPIYEPDSAMGSKKSVKIGTTKKGARRAWSWRA